MQRDLLQDKDGLRAQRWGFTEANFEEFCWARDQITNVQFRNLLVDELNDMYWKCEAAYGDDEKMREIVSETYRAMQRILGE